MADKRKTFGQRSAVRPPPAILHAPSGLAGGPAARSPARKASVTVALFAIGAAAMAGGVAYLSRHEDPACRADAQTPGGPPPNCGGQSSGGHGGSGSGHWYGFSSGSSSSSSGHAMSTASPSGGHGSFGGFGATGAGHSGGGHGSGA